MTRRLSKLRRAVAMFIALTALMLVTLVGAQLLRTLARTQRQSRDHAHAIQALWLADSGIARATARLKVDDGYRGEVWRPTLADSTRGAGVSPASNRTAGETPAPPAAGRVEISVSTDETNALCRKIRVVAAFPDDPVWRVQHVRETIFLVTDRGDRP